MTTYSVLGPLEVRLGDRPVEVARPRRRAVLAYLLLHANDRVDTQQLIDALWAHDPPRTARAQVHTAVSALRTGLPAELGEALLSESTGYRLSVATDELDLSLFRRRLASARAGVADNATAAGAGRAESEKATRALREALALWRGTALAGVDAPFVEPARVRLEEERFSAYESLADLEMAAGRHAELVPLLTGLLDEYPARESIVERLALALYRGGRKTDALAVVRRLRTLLAEEYGLDPGRGIVELENAMLRADPGLEYQAAASSTPAATPSPALAPATALTPPRRNWPRPAQLPRSTAGFVGRTPELAQLARLLSPDAEAPRVAAVTGPAGVGKTSLVLRWARDHAEAFPDGQLFVDLHGFGRQEAETAEHTLERFLLALGIPGYQIPAGCPKREDLFRSAMAERRMLVILDNARDYQQVSPLLPGSALSRTVITSRVRLGGLVADLGAVPVRLDVLPLEDAVEVLARVVGAEPVAASPDAARDLARLCGGLPLALRISAVRLLEEPAAGLAGLAAELRPEADRLGGLDLLDGSHTVSQALDGSRRRLTAEQARLFRLLSLHPGDSLNAATAEAMTGDGDLTFAPSAGVRRRLRALESLHLVDQSDTDRYRMHDLVRLYGRQLPAADPKDDDVAFDRLADWYIGVAKAGLRVLDPARPELAADLRHRLAEPPPFDGEPAGLGWFDQEAGNLHTVLRAAAERADHRVVWQLADAVAAYLIRRHRLDSLAETQTLGEQAALAESRPDAAAVLANNLGIAYAMRRDPRAQEPFERAAALRRARGEHEQAAHITANLGALRYDLGLLHEAAQAQRAAVEAIRPFGSSQAFSAALANLALTLGDLGRLQEARTLYAEAITVAEQCDAKHRAAYARGQLAWVLIRLGDAAEGLALSRATLEHAEETGDVLLDGRMRDQVGVALALLGSWPEARAAWEESVRILARIGSDEAEVVRGRLRGGPGSLPTVGEAAQTPVKQRR